VLSALTPSARPEHDERPVDHDPAGDADDAEAIERLNAPPSGRPVLPNRHTGCARRSLISRSMSFTARVGNADGRLGAAVAHVIGEPPRRLLLGPTDHSQPPFRSRWHRPDADCSALEERKLKGHRLVVLVATSRITAAGLHRWSPRAGSPCRARSIQRGLLLP